ncbi:MAG TPA: mandelate racemase/muconate lactonizing enzyme family protein [Dehalococcoidia bacterium]|jgi:L-alanine-DL-glutamate epimerase-like enolase superfamily enzyme|nr:mandelate racemase/muconate lactonizing enzyme family protein [Dehalococcoidia bacterium]
MPSLHTNPKQTGSPLKITDIKTYVLNTTSVFVRIYTDEGIEGVGECSPVVQSDVTAVYVQKALKPLLIGKDPRDTDRLWDDMYFGTFKIGGMGAGPNAISGVDIALWDIKAKAANMPLYQLMGGATKKTFKMYKSIGGGSRDTAEEMRQKVEYGYNQGFRAFKIRMDWQYHQDKRLKGDLEMFRVCREWLPDEVPLSFDVNNGYSVSAAISQGKEFEKLGIYHYEEPVLPYNYKGMREVADALDVPVSAGEQEYTRWQFRDLIEIARPDLLQPDVTKCCGITEIIRIGAMAEVADMQIIPHMTQPSIGNAASLAFCSTLRHPERPHEYTGPRSDLEALFQEPITFDEATGTITLPDRSGHGLVIEEDAFKAAIVTAYE